MKVAHATPATPHWNTATKIRSSTTLLTEDRMSRTSGVRLSPIALKMPVHTL